MEINNNNQNILSINESYCEFCNKSFCNKYFLKTHMLRSHGKLLNNKQDFDLEDNEYLISQTNLMDAQKQQFNHHLYQHHHHNSMKQFNSDSDNEMNDNNNNSNNTSSTFINGIMDTNFAAKIADRVICDICNKQVCNKYFLKTHKQKVHGIQMSDTNSKLNDLGEDNNSCSSDVSFKMDYGASNTLKIEVNDQSDGQMLNETNSNNDNHLMAKLRQISNSTSANSISPQQQQQTLLQTTSQQIISRDSYCELCKRQFCSKYFLRNHMINMHGINQSKFNYNKTVTPTTAAATTTTTTSATTTPLKNNEKENDGLKKQQSKTSEQINSPLSSISSKLSCNNNNNNNSPSMSTNGNNLASKVACVICNKELCNKYFLRQHLINVHKTSIEEYNEKFEIPSSVKSRNDNDDSINNESNESPDTNAANIDEDANSSKLKLEKLKNNHLKFLSLISANKSLKRRKRQYSENSSISSSSSNSIYSKYSLASLSPLSSSNSSIVSLKTQRHKFFNNKRHKSSKVALLDKNGNFVKQKLDKKTSTHDMQQFFLESSDDVFNSNFMPCMVYLPVKYKLNESVNINLTLKPIKKTSCNENDEMTDKTNTEVEIGEIKANSDNNKNFKKKFIALHDNLNDKQKQQIEIM